MLLSAESYPDEIGLRRFVVNPFAINSYLFWDKVTLEAMIIDAGFYSEEEENEFRQFVNENNLKIKYLITTHGHIDHILGNNFVVSEYSPFVLLPELDMDLIQNVNLQAKIYGLEHKPVPVSDTYLNESECIEIGRWKFIPIFTPGHTKGEYCIYCADLGILFSGDVLFKAGIGRTDLWGGDYDELIKSIKTKLMILPLETVVLPGHDQPTKIKHEWMNNSFL